MGGGGGGQLQKNSQIFLQDEGYPTKRRKKNEASFTLDNRSNGRGDNKRLTPPTKAARGLPAPSPPATPLRCKHASRRATKDEEHAVSIVRLGPTVPRVNDNRFASIDGAAPVLVNQVVRGGGVK